MERVVSMFDDNMFAQLQALSTLSKETTIDTMRQTLNRLVLFFKERPQYMEEVRIMAEEVRFLKVKTLLDCDSFMVQDDFLLTELPEEFQHDSLGFCHGNYCVFEGRYIYPVKDTHGDVMGFCGYDKFSDVKYLDSINYGYRAKTYSMWGMEKMLDYYHSTEPVFFVEGIVCALYLRQCKMQALATLGSTFSPYCTEIVRRFGTRAIIVNDSDEAGTKCRKIMQRRCPLARCVQSTIAKDVDDSRLVDPEFANELRKLSNPFYDSKLFR